MKFIPKYRFLKVGEKIRATDEKLTHFPNYYGEWNKALKFKGLVIKKDDIKYFRRKIGCEIFIDLISGRTYKILPRKSTNIHLSENSIPRFEFDGKVWKQVKSK